MEATDGRLVGIEVKSFVRGIVLYTGERTLNFGTGLTALPIGALWR